MFDNDDLKSSSSKTAPTNTYFSNGVIENTDSSLFSVKKPPPPPTTTTLSSQSSNEQSIFELSKPFNSYHNSNKLVVNNCSINNEKNTNYFSSNQNNDSIFKFNEPTELNSQLKLKYNNRFKNNNNNGNQRNHIVVVEQSPFSVFKSVKSQENIESQNNVVVINALRNHPYNNSIRPNENHSKNENNLNITKSINGSSSSKETNSNDMSTLISNINSDHNMNTNSIVSNANHTNRNSSSNAILAHLKSLSPNFKSIFVRPKSSKQIESSVILNKSKLLYNSRQDRIILPLYNSATTGTGSGATVYNSYTESRQNNNGEKNKLLNLMSIVPNIEPKELRLNSSVDDLLKKFATENDILSDTIKNISTGASSTSSSLLKTIMKQDESIKKQNINNNLNRPVSSTAIHNHHINIYEKWTCMVCLSKHANKIDICSICGSSKPTILNKQTNLNNSSTTNNNISFSKHYSSNTSPTSSLSSTSSLSPSSQIFSSYLLNELGLKHKLDQQQLKISITGSNNNSNLTSFLDQSKSNLISPQRNPYLKKWTCIHCNYSNDSLKVVCLNCRWLKTTPQQYNASLLKESSTSSSSEDSKSSGDATPIKRTKSSSLSNDSTIKQSSNLVCSTCQSPLHGETKDSTEKLLSSQETILVTASTPIKPLSNSLSTASSIASSSTSSSSKWTCDTCLVQNNDSSDKCVCCATAKPVPKSSTTSSLPIISLSNVSSSKWTCDACLVTNDAEKSQCICCMTDRPNGSKKTNQLSETKSTIPSLKPSMPVSTSIPSNIKFGLPSSTSNSTGPISFGSSSITIPTSNIFKSSSEPIKFGTPSSTTTTTTSQSSLFKLPTSNPSTELKSETDKSNNNILGNTTTTGSTFSGFSFKPLDTQTKKPSQETNSIPSKSVENNDKKDKDGSGYQLPKLTFGSSSNSGTSATSTFTPFQFGNITTTSNGVLPSLNSNTDTTTATKPLVNLNQFPSLFPSSTTKASEIEPKSASIESTINSTTSTAVTNPTGQFSLFTATFGANQNKTQAQSTSENKDSNLVKIVESSNYLTNNTGFLPTPAKSNDNNLTQQSSTTPSSLFNFSSSPAPPNITINQNTSEPFKLGIGFTGFGGSTNTASSTTNTELPKLTFNAPSSSLFGNTNQQSSSLFNSGSNSNTSNNQSSSVFSTNNGSTLPKLNLFAQNNTTTGANPITTSITTTQPFSFKSPTNTATTTMTTPSFLQTTNSTPTSLFSSTPLSNSTNSLITPPSNPITQFNTPSIPATFGSITTPPSSIGGGLGNSDLGPSNKLMLNNINNNQTPSFTPTFSNFNFNPSFNFANTQSGIMQFSGNQDSNVSGDSNARKFRRAKRTVNR